MRDVLHWLPVQQRTHYRISSIVCHCVLGNALSYLLELCILTSAGSGRRSLRSASKGGLSGVTCSHCHQTEKGFLDCGSPVWNGLPSELRSLTRVLFINSSRLSSLAEPGLGAPLSSYLEGALYR